MISGGVIRRWGEPKVPAAKSQRSSNHIKKPQWSGLHSVSRQNIFSSSISPGHQTFCGPAPWSAANQPQPVRSERGVLPLNTTSDPERSGRLEVVRPRRQDSELVLGHVADIDVIVIPSSFMQWGCTVTETPNTLQHFPL